MRLDRTRPYSLIGGLPGCAFEQDGNFFNPGGARVTLHKRELTGRDEDGREWKREETYVLVDETPEPEPEKAADAPKGFEDMHYKTLKVMCERFGFEPATKAEAVAFLERSAA